MRKAPVIMAFALLVGCAAPPPVSHPQVGILLPAEWVSAGEERGGEVKEGWLTSFGDDTLVMLVQEALQNNHDLRQTAAALDAALATARIQGADLSPQLDAGFAMSKAQGLSRVQPGSASDFDNFVRTRSTSLGLSLDLSWEVDIWGRLRSQASSALADVQAAEADLGAARLSLAGNISKAWFAAVEARMQLDLARETFESYRETTEMTRSRFDQGLTSALDVHRARSVEAGAEAQIRERDAAFQNTLRSLEVLLGRYPGAETDVASDLPAMPAGVPSGVPAELLERRPDIAAAERRVAAALQSVKSAKAARLPRISLTASGGTSSDALRDIIDPKHDIWNLAMNLLQPVLDGGRLAANVRLEEASKKSAVATYANTVLNAFREVETTLANESLLEAREGSLKLSSREAELAYQQARGKYRKGLAPFLTLLDAQRTALSTRSSLLTVRRLRLENRVDLHLALAGNFLSHDEPEPPAEPAAPEDDMTPPLPPELAHSHE